MSKNDRPSIRPVFIVNVGIMTRAAKVEKDQAKREMETLKNQCTMPPARLPAMSLERDERRK
jgi:hypothetical protein